MLYRVTNAPAERFRSVGSVKRQTADRSVAG